MTLPPDLDRIHDLALQALDTLPDPIRKAAGDILLRVVDWPDEGMMADLGIEEPLELTGLYEGIPLTEKSVMDAAQQPDTIWLFRRPILDEWADRGDVSLKALVGHILVHEMAHHFGWTDDQIAAIDPWWE